MAAITVNMESQDTSSRTCELDGGLSGGPRNCVPTIEAQHAGHMRMLWVRRSLADWASKVSYRVVNRKGELYIETSEPYPRDHIPWAPVTRDPTLHKLIGEAAKMACPTWDLPSGAPNVGGSCPGALAGQTTVAPEAREKAIRKLTVLLEAPVKPRETICQACYVSGNSSYGYADTQLGEMLRYAWTLSCIRRGERGSEERKAGVEEWVSTMVDGIARSTFKSERLLDPITRRPVMPMRVHSSGDFFSFEYALAWFEVARRLPMVRFWAPSRTWASGEWSKFWQENNTPANLIVRPSAYHTDDPAPAPGRHYIACETGRVEDNEPVVEDRLQQPWEGDFGYMTEGGAQVVGTTSVYRFNDKNWHEGKSPAQIAKEGSSDPRYDWQCAAYAVEDDAKTCRNAIAPDGDVGCRACWLHPELRVNYTVH